MLRGATVGEPRDARAGHEIDSSLFARLAPRGLLERFVARLDAAAGQREVPAPWIAFVLCAANDENVALPELVERENDRDRGSEWSVFRGIDSAAMFNSIAVPPALEAR